MPVPYLPQIYDIFGPSALHFGPPLGLFDLSFFSHDFFDLFSLGLHLPLYLLQHALLFLPVFLLLRFTVDHLAAQPVAQILQAPLVLFEQYLLWDKNGIPQPSL